MRVVLDTNVIVSGLLWKGPPKILFDLIEKRGLKLCVTPNIIEEVRRVLLYPKIHKHLNNAGIEPNDAIGYLVRHALVFPDINYVKLVKDDPSDDIFLNCAISCDTQWLISGDKHLLKIINLYGIQIITASQFLIKFRYLL